MIDGGAGEGGESYREGVSAAPRRPNYGRFLGTGALLGLFAAFVVARLAPASPTYQWTDALLYLGLLGILLGGLAGGAVALLFERPRAQPAPEAAQEQALQHPPAAGT